MKVCVCYFLGKHSFGGEKHLFGPPKGSGGKKLFSGPPKGSRWWGGGWGEKGENTPLDHLAGARRRDKGLCKIQLSSCFKHQ